MENFGLIGLSGKAGVGKSTIAEHICCETDGLRLSFADALRAECAELYDIDIDASHTAAGKAAMCSHPALPAPMTVREVMVWHGARRRREDPEYWVRRLLDQIFDLAPGEYEAVVVDDVRMENELTALLDMGATLIRVQPYPGYVADPRIAGDISECGLDHVRMWDGELSPGFGDDCLQRAAQQCLEIVKFHQGLAAGQTYAGAEDTVFWATRVLVDRQAAGHGLEYDLDMLRQYLDALISESVPLAVLNAARPDSEAVILCPEVVLLDLVACLSRLRGTRNDAQAWLVTCLANARAVVQRLIQDCA